MKDKVKSIFGRIAFGLVILALFSFYGFWKEAKVRRHIEEFCTVLGYVGSEVVADSMAYCIQANGSRIDMMKVFRMSIDSAKGQAR